MAWKKNHFDLISGTIKDVRDAEHDQGYEVPGEFAGHQNALDELAESLADKFEDLVPTFDRDRFLDDAGVLIVDVQPTPDSEVNATDHRVSLNIETGEFTGHGRGKR